MILGISSECVHRGQTILSEHVVEASGEILLSDSLKCVVDAQWRQRAGYVAVVQAQITGNTENVIFNISNIQTR